MKKRKPSRKSIVRKADESFQSYIRARDAKEIGHCWFCPKPIQCAFHMITRSNYATRWDEECVVGSCHGCNYRMEFNSAPFHRTYIKTRGLDTWDELVVRSQQPRKFKDAELVAIAEAYRVKREAL